MSQEQPGNREKANVYYNGYEYGKAILLYQKLVDTKNPLLEDMERLAHSSYQVNDYELAVNWYARVVEDPNSAPENLLLYARSLKQIAMYHKAKAVLEQYAAKTGRRDEIALDLAGCDQAIKWLAAPRAYLLVNEEKINTPLSEFGALPIDSTLYYTGEGSSRSARYSWTGNNFLRTYHIPIYGDTQATPSQFKPFNKDNRYHVGPIVGNKSRDTFYVTRTYVGKKGGLHETGKMKYRTNRLELVLYTKEKQEKWKASPFAYNDIEAFSVGHATLDGNGQVLYFVSDRPGSIGGTDIWFCEKNEQGGWGTPQNAGPVINSAKDELFPSISSNGTLYYASNGFIGMGGLDVFKSEGSKSSWSSPENLRHPINSGGDDFALVVANISENGFQGYVSSNRAGGKGGDDIYSFTYPKESMLLILEGTSNEGQGKDRPLAEVSVSLKQKDQKLLAKKVSDGSGTFSFEVEPDREYLLLGQKTKFYSDSLVFYTSGLARHDTLRVDLHLEPLFEEGKKFVLQDIHYDFNKFEIRKDAEAILNELVRIMRENATLRIELSSHTDSRGSDKFNMRLSNQRAESVVEYLVSRGIARDRLQAKGKGESQLLNNCTDTTSCSEEEHQKNRRTEVRVLSF